MTIGATAIGAAAAIAGTVIVQFLVTLASRKDEHRESGVKAVEDAIVLDIAAMFSAQAHAERHSRSLIRLRRSQVRIVLSGTLWRVASSS